MSEEEEQKKEDPQTDNVDDQNIQPVQTNDESPEDVQDPSNKPSNENEGKIIPQHLLNPQQSSSLPPNPMVLVDSVFNKCVDSLKDGVSGVLSPLENRISVVSEQLKKVSTEHTRVLDEFSEFRKKTSDWQNVVKKISKKDLQKIKKLKIALVEKDGYINNLKTSLEKKEEEIRKQVVSETTPDLPQTFDDLHPCLVKRVEFPEQNLIYWAIASPPNENESSHKKEVGIRFIEEEEVYFEDVSDKTGLKLTDEELLKQSRLNLQKAMKACRESDEQLKSYKTRAHIALKKKNDSLEEVRDELNQKEIELSGIREGREREDQEREDLQLEVEERTKEVISIQEELLSLRKERNEFESRFRKQKELLESWERKAKISEENRTKGLLEMEEDYQSQLETQKTNWLKRLNEKEKTILELRKSSGQLPSSLTIPRSRSLLGGSDEEFSSSSAEDSPRIARIEQSISSSSTPKKKDNNKKKKGNMKEEFEEIFALAEIQAKREREIKEKNKSISELKGKLKKYFLLEKEYNKIRKAYQKQAKVLEEVYKKENIPNLEYLKNITIQLLMCDDKPVKKNLLKVVSQMLKFEKHELNKVFNKMINQGNSNSSSIRGIFGL